MRTGSILAALLALTLAGCGGGSGESDPATTTSAATVATGPAGDVTGTGKLPPGAVGPADPAEEQAEGPAATEASPESQAEGPQSNGELAGEDRSTAVATVSDYIRALDR